MVLGVDAVHCFTLTHRIIAGALAVFGLSSVASIASVRAVPPVIPSITEQVALVDSTRLLLSVNQLANMGNRHAFAPEVQSARDWLMTEFEAIRIANPDTPILVFLHSFPFTVREQRAVGDNIVLLIPGTDPTAGAVLIGAHYDTRSEDVSAHDTPQPGADDNGSGVAAVLELARLLATYPHRASVYCVLFAAEEQGRFGSLAFVRDVIQAQQIALHAMINLDMVGVSTGLDGQPHDSELRTYSAPPENSPSRELAHLIAQAAQLYVPDMTVIVHQTLDRPGRWGDHQSFSDAGYAAARLIEPADDPARTHTARDLPDRLDLVYLRRVTQVTLAAVLVLVD